MNGTLETDGEDMNIVAVCYRCKIYEKYCDSVYVGKTINIPLIWDGIARFRNRKPTK